MYKKLGKYTTYISIAVRKESTKNSLVIFILQPTISTDFKTVCDTGLFKVCINAA
jgi:hypothetical protein